MALNAQLSQQLRGNLVPGLSPLLNSHPQSNPRPAVPLGLHLASAAPSPVGRLPSLQPAHAG